MSSSQPVNFLYSIADSNLHRFTQRFNILFVVSIIMALIIFAETRLFIVHYPFTPTTTYLHQHKIAAKRKQEDMFKTAAQNKPALAQSVAQNKIKINDVLFREGKEPNPNSPGDIMIRQIEAAIKELFDDTELEPFWGIYGSPSEVRAEIIPGWLMHAGNIGQCGITLIAWRKNSSSLGPPDSRLFLPDAVTIRDTADDKYPMTDDGRPRIAINLQAFESLDRLKLAIFHEMLHVLGLPAYHPIFSFMELQSDLAYHHDYYPAVNATRVHFWKEQYREWIIWGIILFFCFLMVVAKANSNEMKMFDYLSAMGSKFVRKVRKFPSYFK